MEAEKVVAEALRIARDLHAVPMPSEMTQSLIDEAAKTLTYCADLLRPRTRPEAKDHDR